MVFPHEGIESFHDGNAVKSATAAGPLRAFCRDDAEDDLPGDTEARGELINRLDRDAHVFMFSCDVECRELSFFDQVNNVAIGYLPFGRNLTNSQNRAILWERQARKVELLRREIHLLKGLPHHRGGIHFDSAQQRGQCVRIQVFPKDRAVNVLGDSANIFV